MKLKLSDREIDYFIEYRKRKSVEIRIEPSGMVRVRAPKGSEEAKIIDLVLSKEKWIIEKMDKYFEAGESVNTHKKSGDNLKILGKDYKIIKVINSEFYKPNATLNEDHILVEVMSDDIELVITALDALLRKEARKLLKKRVAHYQGHFKSKPKEITFKDEKGRWGSCSSERVINFNYRIVMAPIDIVDYLVVHEMCHLAHMNHSKSFWTMVGGIIGDYKERKEWLRFNGFTLNIPMSLGVSET